MNGEKYVSIKEIAKMAGVSPQAIYKQLNNKLKTYVKMVDGKKMLNISALDVIEKKSKSTNVEQQLINILQTELNKKNEQIERLEQLISQEQQLRMICETKLLQLEEKQNIKKWWQIWK